MSILTAITIFLICPSTKLGSTQSVMEIVSEEKIKHNYQLYVDAIGWRESGKEKYKAYNKYGYKGKYQFGRAALKDIGIKVKWKEFRNDTALQEYAMCEYLLLNRDRLSRYIDKYEGKFIRGIRITECGILAGAHLGGAVGVKRFLYSNGRRDGKDANGTKISDYIRDFGDYQVSWDKIINLKTKNYETIKRQIGQMEQ